MNKLLLVTALFCSLLVSCQQRQREKDVQLASIQIIDRNGFNETLNSRDRLKKYQEVNFFEPQPYQKVVRAFEKDREGKTKAAMTTYHDNGHIHQYLQLSNGRANGAYKEWFPSGKIRMQAVVIEGAGDLTESAQKTWVFDGENTVYNEDGVKVAAISYEKGALEGVSCYFYDSGELAKTVPYARDKIHGNIEFFDKRGELLGKVSYLDGLKHGSAVFVGNEEQPKREEIYQNGYLLTGKYYNFAGEEQHEIVKGYGFRSVYDKGFLKSVHEYRMGLPDGEVKLFRDNGELESIYHIHNGKKHGEETFYFPSYGADEGVQPFLQIQWKEDEIHGIVKTWYGSGQQESEREMLHNMKNGVSIAWYRDGSLMLVEEYENDTLVSGKYLKKGEEEPISRIVNGTGIATLYDSEGDFIKKVEYRGGKPTDDNK